LGFDAVAAQAGIGSAAARPEVNLFPPKLNPLPSYHMHTRWSDGLASLADMVRHAAAAGFREIGISDHLAIMPGARPTPQWSVPPARLADYVAAIGDAARATDMSVRVGIELDFFPETFSELLDLIAPYPFDYVIGSVHFDGEFPIDGDPTRWNGLCQAEIDLVHRHYWERMADLAQAGHVDFIGHLDLVKKFGFPASAAPEDAIAAALDAVVAAGLPIELNTAGWHKPCQDAYPCERLLRACCRRGIPVVISDDAHETGQIGRDFGRAVELLHRVGYHETLAFANRQRRAVPLAYA
jgi:histidinol-phosphatase (PHP family)